MPSTRRLTYTAMCAMGRTFSKALKARVCIALAAGVMFAGAAEAGAIHLEDALQNNVTNGVTNGVTNEGASGPQDKQQDKTDVLTFSNGDKLTGHFEGSAGKTLTFKSDMAGEVTIEWSKVKELRTSGEYAVIPKNAALNRAEELKTIPKGNVSVEDQKIEIRKSENSAPQTVVTGDADYVVQKDTFDRALAGSRGIFRGWAGTVTAGASLVDATQQSTSFNGAVALLRAIPKEAWMDPHDRTSLNFSFSYGKLTQPVTPEVKTDIYHLDAERDRYFSPSLYGFGQLAYDHNFSQGLDLQQSYGAGLGWTAIKSAIQQLDLKASLNYVKEQFQQGVPASTAAAGQNQDLAGSIFTEIYGRTLPGKIIFNEQLSLSPAWNNTNAYSAAASAGFVMPLYKRLSVTINSADSFLNNPSPGFRKNSFQFTTGFAYSLK